MESFYTVERNTQMLISLLKEHNIRKIIISPGATNVSFVGSVMNDSFFELYSCVDERSASYMACGLAEESGEPVALNCTGATASRNYIPGLTEAFYRKLPVLAITASQHIVHAGNMFPQMLDRSVLAKDVASFSVNIPSISADEDEWACNTKINEALLELRHNGGGPVHINLVSQFKNDYSVKELPKVRVINRYDSMSYMPDLPLCKIVVFIGAHTSMTKELTEIIDSFCKKYNAVVLCDQTSNYRGEYRILANILLDQKKYRPSIIEPDILIHIGNISGAYMSFNPSNVWRVNPDGKVCDPFKKLTKVFEMEEKTFFDYYAGDTEIKDKDDSNLIEWQNEIEALRSHIPELPFSNPHYIFLSSARVYGYSDTPITEKTSRLLDCSEDKEYLETEEYALAKAREENILRCFPQKNWTIIRPYITYNTERLQLGVLEKEQWLYRALHGRTILFFKDIGEHLTTLTYGYDLANILALILCKKESFGETYHITTSESLKWKDILNCYKEVLTNKLGFVPNIKIIDKAEQIKSLNKYQIKYCRLFDRRFDNSKVMKLVGTDYKFISTKEGLKKCLEQFIDEHRTFKIISWELLAEFDRITKDITSLSEITGFKNKVRYMLYRFTPYHRIRPLLERLKLRIIKLID